ncbi:MAG: CvpA family protein, partial [Methylobacter sp.]|nr:CvpA family protein [Methylobacter sp.]
MFYKGLIWIDFTLIAIVFVFIVSGLRRGLDKEAFSLLIWLLASWVGLNL